MSNVHGLARHSIVEPLTNLTQTIDHFVNDMEEGDHVFGICCFVHVCLNDQFVGSAVAFDQSWEFVMDISCQMLQT